MANTASGLSAALESLVPIIKKTEKRSRLQIRGIIPPDIEYQGLPLLSFDFLDD